MLPLIYSEKYNFRIGTHVFPARKYDEIVRHLLRQGDAHRTEMITPRPASDEDLRLVHTAEYLQKLTHDSLSDAERSRIEIPFNHDLFEAFRTAVGGTIQTAALAIEHGLAVHIGGGFHHAFPNHGEGFCVLNDVAIAVRKLLVSHRVKKVMIVDCDLHQGNGNAAIFHRDSAVYTFSIHQQENYPLDKPPSSMDIGLEDGAGDTEYLAALRVIGQLLDAFQPDLVFYLAGADPYQHDQLGGLALTLKGLQERDRFVIESTRHRRIPLAIVLAGGYAWHLTDTVQIHVNTIGEALRVFEGTTRAAAEVDPGKRRTSKE